MMSAHNLGLIMCSLPCKFEKKSSQDKQTQATMIKMGTKWNCGKQNYFCYQNFLQSYCTHKMWHFKIQAHVMDFPSPDLIHISCALLTFCPRDWGLHCTPSHPSNISSTLLFCSVVMTCMPANFLLETSLSEEMLIKIIIIY